MLARSVYARLRPGRNSRASARHIRLTWSASVVSAYTSWCSCTTSATHSFEVGRDHVEDPVRVVERVAAAERRLLGQLREGEEPLGPPHRAQAVAPDRHRQPIHRRPHDAAPYSSRQALIAGRRDAGGVLPVAAEELVGAHPRKQHLHARVARALSQMSTVLIAAGSPMGSSRTSTIRGSRSATSGAISISCKPMPNWRAT